MSSEGAKPQTPTKFKKNLHHFLQELFTNSTFQRNMFFVIPGTL